jgi:hypothetical protein
MNQCFVRTRLGKDVLKRSSGVEMRKNARTNVYEMQNRGHNQTAPSNIYYRDKEEC